MMNEFAGVPDREILVVIAERQVALANEFKKFTDSQGNCNTKMEDRVWNLEINGSKVSQDLAAAAIITDKRLTKVENLITAAESETKTKSSILESIWAKIGIIGALVVAAYWIIKDMMHP